MGRRRERAAAGAEAEGLEERLQAEDHREGAGSAHGDGERGGGQAVRALSSRMTKASRRELFRPWTGFDAMVGMFLNPDPNPLAQPRPPRVLL